MVFNSVDFAIFFGILFVIYWLLRYEKTLQNVVLIVGSIYFYSRLHWSFPVYLGCLILVAYAFGRAIEQTNKKAFLVAGIIVLSIGLVYTKYADFVVSLIPGLNDGKFHLLKLLAPVGISYYTFATIGYLADVYRKEIEVEENLVTFAAYISFFPHLLVGPIPSAKKTLPEFSKSSTLGFEHNERNRDLVVADSDLFSDSSIFTLDKLEQSVAQILWGLFKKMVVADNILLGVNYCFARYDSLPGSSLWIGTTLFGFFLYADFSGYSDIARGVAGLLNINIIRNFQLPFFSRNPGEYWRRWHVSLRNWLVAYLYIPLGGNKGGMGRYIFGILFIFTFSGLWHGANMVFILWGLINGLYFLPYIFTGTMTNYKDVVAQNKWLPNVKELFQMFLTFNLVNLTWVFFRAPDMHTALIYYKGIFSPGIIAAPAEFIYKNLYWCIPMVVVEWLFRKESYVYDVRRFHPAVRIGLYILLAVAICLFYKKQNMAEYYYFKF